jgi:hypothetical protein
MSKPGRAREVAPLSIRDVAVIPAAGDVAELGGVRIEATETAAVIDLHALPAMTVTVALPATTVTVRFPTPAGEWRRLVGMLWPTSISTEEASDDER